MPRKPDRKLESRILKAAYRLWIDQGEHGLTMRAVAKAARTTTPTLYERFKDKHALMLALRHRAQQMLFAAIEPAQSVAETCRLALEFTSTHIHEYELVAKDWAARLSRKEPTPSFDLLKERLARQLGGSPDDYLQLALGITMLYHGTSTLLQSDQLDANTAAFLKKSCTSAADTLVQDAERKIRRRAAD
jgi:AcrR family transcriptional regulator